MNHVAFFIQDFAGGGAERMMINLANGFKTAGYDVDLLVVRTSGPYRDLVRKDIQIIELPAHKVLFNIFKLAEYLKKSEPVALYSTLKHVNIAAIIAARLSRAKTKIVIREASNLLNSFNRNLFQKIAYLLVPFIYKRADVIVAVSKGVAESIRDYCGIDINRIRILPNPSITDDIFEKANVVPTHPFFDKLDKQILLGVGRLSYQKNFQSLIKAFSQLKTEGYDQLLLIIAGEGDDREELESLIKLLGLEKEISLPGFISNPYSYMKHSQVFVLSSRFEGSPNVLVEAMVCGASIVSTDCPSGPREILEDGTLAPLVELDNVEALKEGIIEALLKIDSKKHKDLLLKKAYQYHVSNSVKGYEEIIFSSD